jgi:hypothetical protein
MLTRQCPKSLILNSDVPYNCRTALHCNEHILSPPDQLEFSSIAISLSAQILDFPNRVTNTNMRKHLLESCMELGASLTATKLCNIITGNVQNESPNQHQRRQVASNHHSPIPNRYILIGLDASSGTGCPGLITTEKALSSPTF